MGAIVTAVSAERGAWLIRIGFLQAWQDILPAAEREAVLAEVARRLDAAIRSGDGLRLEVPFACWTAVRSA
jgi:hypothetical protein